MKKQAYCKSHFTNSIFYDRKVNTMPYIELKTNIKITEEREKIHREELGHAIETIPVCKCADIKPLMYLFQCVWNKYYKRDFGKRW